MKKVSDASSEAWMGRIVQPVHILQKYLKDLQRRFYFFMFVVSFNVILPCFIDNINRI